MNLIVAADANWGIGNRQKLLISIPNDQKLFREETVGKVVVLGRKTLATFPQGMPLKDRVNIVLSRNPGFTVKGAQTVHSLEELAAALSPYDTKDVYVVGGESVYRQLLPLCDRAHVTRIDHAYQADAHFPDLDRDPEWRITADSEELTYFDIPYRFVQYERIPKGSGR